ncbi:hypothetical protein MPER_06515 [Moniliophthora perniciosa FA553]|nr:hypothetical protein MPER_06515 [Moniliophthora perniciosa FA553]
MLSKDHIRVAGLTEHDWYRLGEAVERDSFMPTKWNGPSRHRHRVWDASSRDFWVLGSVHINDLPMTMKIPEWCDKYGVAEDVRDWLEEHNVGLTGHLMFLFIPRISLGQFLVLRKAVEAWAGKPISLTNGYFPDNYVYPDMSIESFLPESFDREMRQKLIDSGVKNANLLGYLSLDHAQALGWSPIECYRLEWAAAKHCGGDLETILL